jgi:hypothetical protein
MNRKQWIVSRSPEKMLAALSSRPDSRRLRLFACACCRRFFPNLPLELRNRILMHELVADGVASDDDCRLLCPDNPPLRPWFGLLVEAGRGDSPLQAARAAIETLTSYVGNHAKLEGAVKADLLRHIFRNPFAPGSLPSHVSISVRDLAESVYQQNQAAVGPLHDSLLDTGLSDLADHFQDPAEWHPKGCWAIDLLTGRC